MNRKFRGQTPKANTFKIKAYCKGYNRRLDTQKNGMHGPGFESRLQTKSSKNKKFFSLL